MQTNAGAYVKAYAQADASSRRNVIESIWYRREFVSAIAQEILSTRIIFRSNRLFNSRLLIASNKVKNMAAINANALIAVQLYRSISVQSHEIELFHSTVLRPQYTPSTKQQNKRKLIYLKVTVAHMDTRSECQQRMTRTA